MMPQTGCNVNVLVTMMNYMELPHPWDLMFNKMNIPEACSNQTNIPILLEHHPNSMNA